MKLQLSLLCLFLMLTLSSAVSRTLPKRVGATKFQKLYYDNSIRHAVLAKASASFPGKRNRFYQFEVNLEFDSCQAIHYAVAVRNPGCKRPVVVGKHYVVLLQDRFQETTVCPFVIEVNKLSWVDRKFLRNRARCCGNVHCARKAFKPW